MLEIAEPKIEKRRGRPKGSRTQPKHYTGADASRAYALRHAERAIARLAILMDKADTDTAKIAACKEILDRAYGKAPQAITGEDGGPLRNEVIIRIIEAGIGSRHPAAIEGVGYTSDEV